VRVSRGAAGGALVEEGERERDARDAEDLLGPLLPDHVLVEVCDELQGTASAWVREEGGRARADAHLEVRGSSRP